MIYLGDRDSHCWRHLELGLLDSHTRVDGLCVNGMLHEVVPSEEVAETLHLRSREISLRKSRKSNTHGTEFLILLAHDERYKRGSPFQTSLSCSRPVVIGNMREAAAAWTSHQLKA